MSCPNLAHERQTEEGESAAHPAQKGWKNLGTRRSERGDVDLFSDLSGRESFFDLFHPKDERIDDDPGT